MKYVVMFQYKPPDAVRPYDERVNDIDIEFDEGEFLPISDVGDSVELTSGGEFRTYKVLSHHFIHDDVCVVNIVVTDVSAEEKRARIKA